MNTLDKEEITTLTKDLMVAEADIRKFKPLLQEAENIRKENTELIEQFMAKHYPTGGSIRVYIKEKVFVIVRRQVDECEDTWVVETYQPD